MNVPPYAYHALIDYARDRSKRVLKREERAFWEEIESQFRAACGCWYHRPLSARHIALILAALLAVAVAIAKLAPDGW